MSTGNPWRDGFPKMTVGELVKLGEKLRPSSEVLNKLSDDDLAEIIQFNWKEWTESSRGIVNNEMPEETLPELFKSCNINKIKLFRELSEKEIKDGADDSFIDGVTEGRLSVGEAGSTQGLRCMDYSLPTANRLINGIRFWVIIADRESSGKLDKLIAKNNNKTHKSGCLGTGGAYLLDLQRLKKENIEYRTIIQREDEVVVIPDGVYYYWINLFDFTEVVSVYFTTDSWFETGKKREVERCSCRKTFTLNWAKMEKEGRMNPRTTVEDATDNVPEVENKKEQQPKDKEGSEQTTVDQDETQISEDLENVKLK